MSFAEQGTLSPEEQLAAVERMRARMKAKDKPTGDSATHQQVVITDIQMPFWSMVTFMVKWAIATIPAAMILIFFCIMVIQVAGALLLGKTIIG